jgi:hypothetical protein
MPQLSMGAFITLTVGSKDITLDTADAFRKPVVFGMPANTSITVTLADIEAWLDSVGAGLGDKLSQHPFLENVVKTRSLQIDEFLLSTSGDIRLSISMIKNDPNIDLGNVAGLSIKAIGFRFTRVADPVIMSVLPAKAVRGGSLSIGGTGFVKAKSVGVGAPGSSAADATPLTVIKNADNFFLDVAIPASSTFPSGALDLFVTTADGTVLDSGTSHPPVTLTIANS